MMVVIFSRTP